MKANVVKRNNSLMCISTDRLRMLDISNYLAPTSYSGYLKAFKIPEQKGYFCYEYLKRFDQLYETQLFLTLTSVSIPTSRGKTHSTAKATKKKVDECGENWTRCGRKRA